MSMTTTTRKANTKAANEAKHARQCKLNLLCDKLRTCGYTGSNADILAWFEEDVKAGSLQTGTQGTGLF